jgi:hypothetical protein
MMEPHNFFGLGSLADLGTRRGIDMRPTLLRVLTDLYVHRLSHTADEERHYTELALPMLDVVDAPTRVAVARRFARYFSPPLRVLQRLVRDVPEVAVELRAHPLLQPLIPAAAAPQEVSATSHARHRAPDGDSQRTNPPYAIDAATANELNDLFFAASAEERRLILLNLDIVAPVPVARIRTAPDPSLGRQLETAVLSGKRADFANHLARDLHIPGEQARRIVSDELGEPVVVVGKALGMPRDLLYRILMFVNPAVGHSVERVHALAALYDDITASAAEGMLAIWQALHHQERPATTHRPLAWDDEAHEPARPGSTAAHRGPAAATLRVGERRNAS